MVESFSGGCSVDCYKVLEYAYCHPKNVVIRKKASKLLKWQHVVGLSDLEIFARKVNKESRLCSLILRHGALVLESLDPLKKLISRGLQVRTYRNWISFKWTTGKGNTQFQIRMSNSGETKRLLKAISDSGIKVYNNVFSRETPVQWSSEDSKGLRTFDDNSQNFSQTQVEHFFVDNEASCQNFSQSQFRVQSQTQVEAPVSIWHSDLPSDSTSLRPSSFGRQSECISLLEESANSRSGKQNLKAPRIDVIKHIDACETLHLTIEAFSFASATTQQVNNLKWNHVGLASNICLSLIVMNKDQQPELMVNRGCTELARLLVEKYTLRAYVTEAQVILCHATEGALGPRKYYQLQMKPENISVLRNWLKYWRVSVEDPSVAIPATEATTLNSWGHLPMSRASNTSEISRSSVYWNHRLRPPSQHNVATHSSKVSRNL